MRFARASLRRKAILFVTHEDSTGNASLRYRSLYHAETLALFGVVCDVVQYGTRDLFESIGRYDCAVLHRVPWPAAAPLIW